MSEGPAPASDSEPTGVAAAAPPRTAAPEGTGPSGISEAPATASRRRLWVSTISVGVLVTAVHWLFAARQWALYRVPSWDLGIYTQIVRAYAERESFVMPIIGPDFFILGDHFNPHLALYAPFYALHPSGFTLLAAQAVMFGLTAAIITHAAVRHLGSWGVAIGAAAGLSYLLVEAQAAQFHDIATALPLLAVAMVMLLERRPLAAVLWSLPLLLVKEDLGLTVAAIGAVVVLRATSWRERRIGLAGVVVGLAAFVLVTQVVLPALSPSGTWGHASDSILSLVLSDPGAALERLTTGLDVKIGMVVLPILITGLVSVRSPLILVALPTIAWRLTSDSANHWGNAFHYGAVFAPIAFLALVDALPGVRARVAERHRSLVVPAVSYVVASVAIVALPFFSLWTFTDPGTWRDNPTAAAARAAERQVADGESVVTTIHLLAYLVPRAEVMWYGTAGNPQPDVYVIQQRGEDQPPPHDAVGIAQQLHPEVTWTQVWQEWPYSAARPAQP